MFFSRRRNQGAASWISFPARGDEVAGLTSTPPLSALAACLGVLCPIGGNRLGTQRKFLALVQQIGGSGLGQKSSQRKAVLRAGGQGKGLAQ